MRRFSPILAAGIALVAFIGLAQQAPTTGPYKVLKTAKVGGDGGFDYVYADDAGRRLYIPRTGTTPRIAVFNLDTLEPVGEIAKASAHGVAVDPKSKHGFSSSKPLVMWDTKTLATIKTIEVQGNPDGILFDPFNQRVWVLSHSQPNATVIDAKDGSIVGTLDLGGAPEQAVTDGKGHLYIDLEDKDKIAAVDAKTLKVTAQYDLAGKGGGPGGLAFDVKNHILFATCHDPAPWRCSIPTREKSSPPCPSAPAPMAPRSTPRPWKRSAPTVMARSVSSRKTALPASWWNRTCPPCLAPKH